MNGEARRRTADILAAMRCRLASPSCEAFAHRIDRILSAGNKSSPPARPRCRGRAQSASVFVRSGRHKGGQVGRECWSHGAGRSLARRALQTGNSTRHGGAARGGPSQGWSWGVIMGNRQIETTPIRRRASGKLYPGARRLLGGVRTGRSCHSALPSQAHPRPYSPGSFLRGLRVYAKAGIDSLVFDEFHGRRRPCRPRA